MNLDEAKEKLTSIKKEAELLPKTSDANTLLLILGLAEIVLDLEKRVRRLEDK